MVALLRTFVVTPWLIVAFNSQCPEFQGVESPFEDSKSFKTIAQQIIKNTCSKNSLGDKSMVTILGVCVVVVAAAAVVIVIVIVLVVVVLVVVVVVVFRDCLEHSERDQLARCPNQQVDAFLGAMGWNRFNSIINHHKSTYVSIYIYMCVLHTCTSRKSTCVSIYVTYMMYIS